MKEPKDDLLTDSFNSQNTKKLTRIVLILLPIVFLSLVLLFYILLGLLKKEGTILGSDEYTLDYVIDGDTIAVSQYGTQYKVRYIGIDTPEIEHKPKPEECYGNEATEYNKKLLRETKKIKLIKDKRDKDVYGRLLRYVYVDNTFVNAEIIKNGYAYVLNISPNSEFKEEFSNLANKAKENNLGVWGYCALEDKRAR